MKTKESYLIEQTRLWRRAMAEASMKGHIAIECRKCRKPYVTTQAAAPIRICSPCWMRPGWMR